MKCCVVGKGKTGSEVVKALPKNCCVGPFSSSHPLKITDLTDVDCAIVFTPGDAVAKLIPLFLEAKCPVIWGSTGFEWPMGLNETLAEKGLTWVHGHNFSLSMAYLSFLIQATGKLSALLPSPTFLIEEKHHANKKDAPSGTALLWEEWLAHPAKISSQREGDVIGEHSLIVEMKSERISIAHKAKSRRLFAEGALWAAEQVVINNSLTPGLHRFKELTDKRIEELQLCQTF